MPAVAQGESAGNDDGCRLKPPADSESNDIFSPLRRRGPLLVRMGVYFLLTSSFACFAASLLLLLSPQSFPLQPFTFVKQKATDKPSNQWNILYHLGGNGPWIPKIDGVVDGGIAVPNGCRIDMIHMVGCLLCVVIQESRADQNRCHDMARDTQLKTLAHVSRA